jgi:hypothetical protein
MQADQALSGSAQGSTILSDRVLVGVLVASLAITLAYVRSLIFFDTPSIIFDASHFVSVVALTIILVKSSRIKFSEQVLLVALWVLAMRMLIPIRFPEGIITNYPDMIYELQIVQKIAATGGISFNVPTNYAEGYIFTPMLETFVVMSSTVLGIPFATVLKYAGPFFGVFTIVFLVGFFRAFLPNREAIIAGFIAGSCFWFLRFDSITVHQPLALAFLSLALYTLTRPGTAWRFLTILAVFATVASHEFTAIVSSVFFLIVAVGILVLARWFGMKRGPLESEMLRMPGLMWTMTFAWLVFVALPFFANSLGLVYYVIDALLSSSSAISFPLTVAKTVPTTWDRIVGDVGVVSFAATCAAGFSWTLIKREASRYLKLLPYAASSGLLFFIGLLFYFKSNQASDLLSRAFIYVYFFTAPLSLYTILKISSILRRKIIYQQVIAICLICIIVVPGVYYAYSRSVHDNSAPLDVEDVRFPLFQWQSAGYFALNHVGNNILWGDLIAFNYVGGYGDKNVLQPDPSVTNLTLSQWLAAYPSPGDIVVLRHSMPIVPYYNYQVTSNGLHEILVTHDVIYSSGEVTMVVQS